MSDSFLCDVCNKTYKTDKTLQQHKAKMHSNVNNATQPVQQQPVQKQPAQKQTAQKQTAQKQTAQKQPAKQTTKSASGTQQKQTKSAQPQQTGGQARSGQAQSAQQTQNDSGPTRHYIITGVSRKNAQEMAASNPPVRPPDTLETLRNDIDELRMLVYALVRTHYIQSLTENSRMEPDSSSDSDGCGEKCGETECTCE